MCRALVSEREACGILTYRKSLWGAVQGSFVVHATGLLGGSIFRVRLVRITHVEFPAERSRVLLLVNLHLI